jgi:hypothetical protein
VADEQSIVVISADSAEVARVELATELERVLQLGATAIAEAIPGLFASGKWGAARVGGRIVQGALKYKLFQQVSKEIQELRAKGKIADEFAEKKYAFNSGVELLTVMDNETPDEDRLEALKAMFYSVNKINATEGESVANYQLFQIAKKLTSASSSILELPTDSSMPTISRRDGQHSRLARQNWEITGSRRNWLAGPGRYGFNWTRAS